MYAYDITSQSNNNNDDDDDEMYEEGKKTIHRNPSIYPSALCYT